MRAKYVTSKYELDDLTRLVIRVGLYVFPAWCRRTRWWFDYIMSASFGHRHHSTWFWELLYYFTVVERFARFAHARHHSDKLWSLVGGGRPQTPSSMAAESFSASTRKENLKNMYFKSWNAGSHWFDDFGSSRRNFFLPDRNLPAARSFCGRSEMNQILLWCKNEVGSEQGLTNGV